MVHMELNTASIASFIIGSIGAVLCVGAYIATNFAAKLGRYGLKQTDITYHVMNSVGMSWG